MITWNISVLDVKPAEGDLTDVVITAPSPQQKSNKTLT